MEPTRVLEFSESFAEQDLLHFQIILLGGATYVWVGTEDGRQDALAMGVPSTIASRPPAGTTLLGASNTDGASAPWPARRSPGNQAMSPCLNPPVTIPSQFSSNG